jgi:predicted nucleic acid-binding protein
MVYIDANVFVLSLMDHSAKGEAAREFMGLVSRQGFDAVTSSLTMDEVMWVFIKSGRKDSLTKAVRGFYESGMRFLPVSSQAPLKACGIMDEYHLRPRDAIHLAVMKENGIGEILSEDKHFDKVSWVNRYSVKEFVGKFGSR